ncbi:TetR/AcrR family transcriptional regulator [Methylobacterium iners]|uniref:Nucleoid occlusion factor SlmA n=1 Tax=Methylobacterium iners TaxID=418707 RepID=A0ABQ4S6A9_9HYPH|nr:TetR/AcrR family transcriptional regulator [Methylobacterium iners]GJD97912.1 Nucleoid occlusion factor SlmA [Methylobacterium iners]
MTAPDPTAPATPELRCRILSIAERLFREIGYRKTTVADIAAALRMSPGNVYRFFPSKKALNESVAELLLGEIEAELARIVERRDLDVAERLRAFLSALHGMSAERFTVDRRMHEMVEVAITENWEVCRRYRTQINGLLRRLVVEGMETGEFAAGDPKVAADCIQLAIVRFCHPALIAQCDGEPGPGVDEMARFILDGLRPR